MRIKAVNDHVAVLAFAVAIGLQQVEHNLVDVLAFAFVEGGLFDLGKQPHVPAGTFVESFDEADLFLQRMQLIGVGCLGEAIRVGLFAAAMIEALGSVELPDFGQGEVNGVEAAIFTLPLGKLRGNVGKRVKVNVVQHEGNAVAGQDDILFQEVCALGMGHGLGGQRVLRQIAAGTTVSHDELFACSNRGAAKQQQNQNNEIFHIRGPLV